MDVWGFCHTFRVFSYTLAEYVAVVNSLPCF